MERNGWAIAPNCVPSLHPPLIMCNKWMMMTTTTTVWGNSQVIVDIVAGGYNLKHFLWNIFFLRIVGRQSILATAVVDSCDL